MTYKHVFVWAAVLFVWLIILSGCTTPASVLDSAVTAGCDLKAFKVTKTSTEVTCKDGAK